MPTRSHLRAALALLALLWGLHSTSAEACRAFRGWSTGADLGKLKAGEIVVKAKLIESYKGEQTFPSVMGLPHGMMYFVHVTKVVGSAEDARVQLKDDAQVFVRLRPSVCEEYFPRNFVKDAEKMLVLKEGASGVFDLVGGQE